MGTGLNKDEINFLKSLLLKNEQMNTLIVMKIVQSIKDTCEECGRKKDCWANAFFGLMATSDGRCENWVEESMYFQDCSNH